MMSVEQARKHLDKKTNQKMSDEQVQELLEETYKFADFVIDVYLDNKRKKQ